MEGNTFLYHQEHGSEIFTLEEVADAVKHGWVTTPAKLHSCAPWNPQNTFKGRFVEHFGLLFEVKYFSADPISSADRALVNRLLSGKGASLSAFIKGKGGRVSVDEDRNAAKPVFDTIIDELGDKVKKGNNNTWYLAQPATELKPEDEPSGE